MNNEIIIMKELFKKQYEISIPETEERINIRTNVKYFNNDRFQIGDIVLYAILLIHDDGQDSVFRMILLSEKHFDLFEQSNKLHLTQNRFLPELKFKDPNNIKLFNLKC